MRSSSMLTVIYFAIAYTCMAEEACDANMDKDTDGSCMLQSGAGVVEKHNEDHHDHIEAKNVDHHEAVQVLGEEAEDKGFPDILNDLANAVGGTQKLSKEFEHVKDEVEAFAGEINTAIATLQHSVTTNGKSIDAVKGSVETFYTSCAASTNKLTASVTKVESAALDGAIGKMLPESFKSTLKSTIDQIKGQATQFAGTFTHAASQLKMATNKTMICGKVSTQLHRIRTKVTELTASATGMTTKGLNKDIVKAKDMLPDIVKGKVDEILKQALKAFDDLQAKVTPMAQDISHGVAVAFQGQCVGTQLESGAGRVEVGLLSALVMTVFVLSA